MRVGPGSISGLLRGVNRSRSTLAAPSIDGEQVISDNSPSTVVTVRVHPVGVNSTLAEFAKYMTTHLSL
jgi:hypothetical protein